MGEETITGRAGSPGCHSERSPQPRRVAASRVNSGIGMPKQAPRHAWWAQVAGARSGTELGVVLERERIAVVDVAYARPQHLGDLHLLGARVLAEIAAGRQ